MDLKKCAALPMTLIRKLDLLAKSSKFIKRYLNGDEVVAIASAVFADDDFGSQWFMWGSRQIVVQARPGERPCIFAV